MYQGRTGLVADVEINMKRCPKCKLTKSTKDFYKDSSRHDGLQSHCIKCLREYYLNGPGRNKHYLRRYGITLSQYNKMFKKQSSICAICKTGTFSGPGERLHVDHCHSTGKIRGLLCNSCNMMLGRAKDNIDILESAIEYLSSHHSLVGKTTAL